MTVQNKSQFQEAFRSLISGLSTNLAEVPSLHLYGTDYAVPDLLAYLDTFVRAVDETRLARDAWLIAVKKEQELAKVALAAREGIKGILISRYGKSSPRLREFGFSPPKERHIDVATMALAVLKSRATRAARHTMGPKQRLAMTGKVETPGSAP